LVLGSDARYRRCVKDFSFGFWQLELNSFPCKIYRSPSRINLENAGTLVLGSDALCVRRIECYNLAKRRVTLFCMGNAIPGDSE